MPLPAVTWATCRAAWRLLHSVLPARPPRPPRPRRAQRCPGTPHSEATRRPTWLLLHEHGPGSKTRFRRDARRPSRAQLNVGNARNVSSPRHVDACNLKRRKDTAPARRSSHRRRRRPGHAASVGPGAPRVPVTEVDGVCGVELDGFAVEVHGGLEVLHLHLLVA